MKLWPILLLNEACGAILVPFIKMLNVLSQYIFTALVINILLLCLK